MKKHNRIVVLFVTIVLSSILFPTVACANSSEPPSFTVIVSNPPDDLSISLQLPGQSQTKPIVLMKEQKAWETYYRFFYHMSPFGNDNLAGAMLIVQSGEKNFQCSLPAATFNTYNNLLTLDLEAESLTIGQSLLRVPILVAMRVALTLLIEGVVFFLFGYREKRSWLAFFAINIITQSGLNAMLTGPGVGSYWIIGFIFGEIIVLAVEMAAFIGLMKEFTKSRAALYTITANAASLLSGGLLIAYFPM